MEPEIITQEMLPRLGKDRDHKFDHGHALVVSGGRGQTGAARLAARGALRIGAGLVTLAVPDAAVPEVAGQITAVMMKPCEDKPDLRRILEDPRITSVCIGPGLGLTETAERLVAATLDSLEAHPVRTAVLDADALTLLARRKDLFDRLSSQVVLTPHGGEFARLFPGLVPRLKAAAPDQLVAEKARVTQDAASRSGAVVVFKGVDTLIAHPDGQVARHSATGARAAPWLATAGSGDVLAGFVAGLVARGYGPMQAARTAVWLHVECARVFGPGLIAEDLPDVLPRVLAALES